MQGLRVYPRQREALGPAHSGVLRAAVGGLSTGLDTPSGTPELATGGFGHAPRCTQKHCLQMKFTGEVKAAPAVRQAARCTRSQAFDERLCFLGLL